MEVHRNPAEDSLRQAEAEEVLSGEIKISFPADEPDSKTASSRLFFFEARPASSLSSPKIYPNNTLLEDLSKCHENLKPELVRAASRLRDLVGASGPGTKSKSAHIQRSSRDDLSESSDRMPIESQPRRNVERRDRFVMPSSLKKLNSTLSADDYNSALSVLSSDMRFKLHLMIYNRIQPIWTLITTGICVLGALLTFTTLTSVIMAAIWLALQATGLFVCRRARKRLDQMLERSVAQVNTFFMDHNLMIGVINQGGLLTKSRFVVPIVFFDAFQCIEQIDSMVRRDLISMQTSSDRDRDKQRDRSEAKELGANQRVLVRAQLAKKIVLDFSQRWISHFDRSKLLLRDDGSRPRHLSTGKCLCQFIEEKLADGGENSELSAEEAVREVPKGIDEEATKINIWPNDNALERSGQNSKSTSPIDKTYELSAIDLLQNINQISLIKANDELGKSMDTAVSFSYLHDRATIESSHGSDWSLSLDQDVSFHDQSESIFRNLKTLFEFRGNELSKSSEDNSPLDLGKSSPSESRLTPNSVAIDQGDKTDDLLSSGKRFFARFDGVSSLITRKNKPMGLYASPPRQMLEIH